MSTKLKVKLNQPYFSSETKTVHCPDTDKANYAEGTKFGSYPEIEIDYSELLSIVEAGFGEQIIDAPPATTKTAKT